MPDLAQFTSLGGFLGLLAYIVFQDWRTGKFAKKEDQPIEKMQGDMNHLRLHFNDELTAVLTSMQIKQGENSEVLNDVKEILNDFQRNGIRIRGR